MDLSGSSQGAGGGLLQVSAFSPSAFSAFTAYDANGNVIGHVDTSTGALTAEYEYSPFGDTVKATGPAANAQLFTLYL